MDAIFKIIIFTFMLNLSVGILTLIPDSTGNHMIFNSSAQPLIYKEGMTTDFQNGLSGDVNPSGGALSWTSNVFNRIVDVITLGYGNKIKETLNRYLFGFVVVLESVFGGMMTSGLNLLIFGGLKTLITILYIVGVIEFFTGKRIQGAT
jgi:hypothetical protein